MLVSNLLPFMEGSENRKLIGKDSLSAIFYEKEYLMESVQQMYQILYRESVVEILMERTPLEMDIARIIEQFLIEILPEYGDDFKFEFERFAPDYRNRNGSLRHKGIT